MKALPISKDRRDAILVAALQLCQGRHYQQVSLREIAREAGVSHPLVLWHFGSIAELRREMVKQAVREERWKIVADAILASDPAVRNWNRKKKREVLDRVT